MMLLAVALAAMHIPGQLLPSGFSGSEICIDGLQWRFRLSQLHCCSSCLQHDCFDGADRGGGHQFPGGTLKRPTMTMQAMQVCCKRRHDFGLSRPSTLTSLSPSVCESQWLTAAHPAEEGCTMQRLRRICCLESQLCLVSRDGSCHPFCKI